MQHKHAISLVTCARWEEDAIVEWIEYHKAIGVDHFYIYSNDDTPWTLLRVITPYLIGDAPIVTYRHWPHIGQQPQIYFHFLETFKDETEWFCFLDIDEFIVLKTVNSISRFLNPFHQNYDAVYLNWAVYGNNGFVNRNFGSLLLSHTRRAARIDPHTKVLTRAAAIDAADVRNRYLARNIGFWHFWNDFGLDLARITNVLGDRIDDYSEAFPRQALAYLYTPGVSERMLATAYVAHFQFKSEEDFIRRGKRGGFPNAGHWERIFADGSYRTLLARYNDVSDTYLAEFWSQFAGAIIETAAIQIVPRPNLPNVALQKPSRQSSCYEAEPQIRAHNEGHGNDGFRSGAFGFHTALETEPWWMVDLLRTHVIAEIHVYNRLDSPGVDERACDIAIEASGEETGWREIYSNQGRSFKGVKGGPLVVQFDPPVLARFVRIISRRRTMLHLDEIEVYGTPSI